LFVVVQLLDLLEAELTESAPSRALASLLAVASSLHDVEPADRSAQHGSTPPS
jgi:hypothetical protein